MRYKKGTNDDFNTKCIISYFDGTTTKCRIQQPKEKYQKKDM